MASYTINPKVCIEGHDMLVEVDNLFREKKYKECDTKLDKLYEQYADGDVWLSAIDSNHMFTLLGALAHILYG